MTGILSFKNIMKMDRRSNKYAVAPRSCLYHTSKSALQIVSISSRCRYQTFQKHLGWRKPSKDSFPICTTDLKTRTTLDLRRMQNITCQKQCLRRKRKNSTSTTKMRQNLWYSLISKKNSSATVSLM